MGIKLTLLIVFFAVMVAVGLYSRKHATSVDGFVLGGRSVGPWLTAFAYGTSYFSAVVFVGYAGQFGWKYGLSSTWIGIGNALIGSLLAWVVLGRRTKVMSQHLKSKTMPDFFGERYSSKVLKIAASAIVFIFLVPYTASIYNGLSRLFGMAFNIPYTYCVIAMAVFTGIYVILGGYMATAINDFIQGIIMLIGIVAVIAAVLSGQGGFLEAIRKMAEIPSDVPVTLGQPGAFTSFFGPDPLNLLGVVILTSLGTWGLPQMIGKFYAIKDEKAINTGTVISTLFACVVAGGSYFLGGFGRLFDGSAIYDEAGNVVFDSIVPYMLSTLPDILIGVVVVLVLSASMSTLASLVLTSSSTLTLDFLKDNVMKNMSERKQVRTMQVLIVFFIAVSVVIALDPPTFIAQLMGISWGALAGAFLAPFLYGLYWRGVTKAAVWASFAAGVGITVSNMFLHYIASPINAGAVAMIAGLVVVPVVSILTPKLKKEHVDDIFTCYEEKVTITKKRSLEAN
ncbi:sodium:solute symporter [Lachnospiraceae bacterium]|uniref:sodium:solute symporter family transporter n=1 Tax=Extibacter sp. GGCC_0201 TaxID=2731209 RepID=UPI001AA1C4DF|nr:sodium:solute symporter [Extibacter sp. GGCC_0201]MBO1719695.1 sodium:solute symporter [Extibacter sp. GGCC_0201]BDF33808.1 sodium:solute symporter [Lachnospiraceae bacterium]BDF37813.1 sodium:solute symporter [Lachnospiraceae bacterium]